MFTGAKMACSTAYQARACLKLIGATQESDSNGDGPSGSRMVTNDLVPQDEVLANQDNGMIRCTECNRSFKGTRGLGVHMRSAHPVEQNEQINVERTKLRWSSEEIERMAREEAGASRDVNINQHLLGRFPRRSLEAIKGQRKRQSYKDRVAALQAAGNIELEVDAHVSGDVDDGGVGELTDDAIKEHIRALIDRLDGNDLQSTRTLVEHARRVLNNNPLEPRTLVRWLKTTFKDTTPPRGIVYKGPVARANLTKKKRRQEEYALIQRLYKKSFGSAVRKVLAGADTENVMPPTEEVVAFWKHIFENEQVEGNDEQNNEYIRSEQLDRIWAPIDISDINACEMDLDSAAGLDGITVANWRAVCANVRALFYNLVLLNGSLDDELKRARTVLIPKGSGIISASNTRPLSITSVVVRQLHKIFAKRFKDLHTFDQSQRAFIDCDGTVENLTILSTILADARMSKREVHIATLDLRKAFDSVSHKTIIDTLTALGCPKRFILYIKKLYSDSTTNLQYGSRNTILKVKQGVLQGDPLSPLLFNAVMDRAIKRLPEGIGYKINGLLFNCIAYADDIILVASTREGLQSSIDALTSRLATFGLKTNTDKSSTLSLVPSGREKKVKVVCDAQFTVDGNPLNAVGILETWKYLGIRFTGSDKSECDVGLAADLDKISRAPLKPQQRLKMLSMAVVPRHLHALVLGRVNKGKLKNLDMVIRQYVRKWLHFPNDVPLAYFYADVCDGGLGIPNLSQQVPLIRKSRITRFINKENDTARPFKQSQYVQRQLKWCDDMLRHIGNDVSKGKKSRYWRDVLGNMVDTNDLADARRDAASNSWVRSHADEVSGGDYIHNHHIRAGCLPSKSRTTRGSDNDRLCRGGCMVSETNYHIVQQCHRSHGGRIKRHDCVVDKLSDFLKSRDGVNVFKEPKLKTQIGMRKPDLIIVKNQKATVIDVQIVSGRSMERDHATKVAKYQHIVGIDDVIKQRFRGHFVHTVEFHAVTISYKGVIEKDTSKFLKELGINGKLKSWIVMSVLRGAWMNWTLFNRITTMAR